MSDPHPLELAEEHNQEINDALAETDGAICSMAMAGPIGYHVNVATGETDPEYLAKVALLQALDESVFELFHVDGDTPGEARRQVEPQLRRSFNPSTADHVAELFEQKLRALVTKQEEIAAGGDGA